MGLTDHVAVECRKIVTTRSGRGLLLVAVVLVAAGAVIAAAAPADSRVVLVRDSFAMAVAPLVLFVPIIALTAFTSEWSTRSALLTFTLSPRRARVFAGKLGLGVLLSLALPLIAFAFAVIATHVAHPARLVSYADAFGVDGGLLQNMILTTVYTLMAVGVATVVRLTSVALTAFLVLTLVSDTVIGLVLGDAGKWFSLITGFEQISSAAIAGPTEIGQAVSVLLVWILLPLTVGFRRFVRSDVS
ncbi:MULTISPECIES: hypothetical protein [Micromonospora]|uniref:ABC-2 family transporter protein n=1 Tax=Micromonospora chokoriensis TaxID=356851 RepID=A0A1C4YTS9_9ACTN|nr:MULTISPECIES: hypothetical protein [Micromonospora]MDG4838197.1 hypothetical protein [Micromonospora sp. WMMD967]SCF24070.1 ABC-2 family transporter protein [Micromonospora chokoriensis]